MNRSPVVVINNEPVLGGRIVVEGESGDRVVRRIGGGPNGVHGRRADGVAAAVLKNRLSSPAAGVCGGAVLVPFSYQFAGNDQLLFPPAIDGPTQVKVFSVPCAVSHISRYGASSLPK